MMKVKYGFHPADYAIGEMEQYYAEQAAKGWLLEKRGNYLSKFRRSEPQRLRYRVELCRALGEEELPKAQVELYEDCGWRYVTGRRRVQLFCAPEHSGVPEIYTTPEEQTAMLKGLRREYRVSFGLVLSFLALFLVVNLLMGETLVDQWTELAVQVVRFTALYLLYFAVIAIGVWELVRGAVGIALLHRRLKNGQPLDHTVKRRLPISVAHVRIVLCGLALALLVAQIVTIRMYDLPGAPDGPYLTFSELGIEGEHTTAPLGGESRVETCRSLMAEIWDTEEVIEHEGEVVILYQDVYRMNSVQSAQWFSGILRGNAVLTSHESFSEIEIAGLDSVWVGQNELVAVKGNLTYYITLIDFGGDEDMDVVLSALAG